MKEHAYDRMMKLIIVISSIFLFLFSLGLPAFSMNDKSFDGPCYGIGALIYGWLPFYSRVIKSFYNLALLTSVWCFSWLANLFIIPAWVILFRKIKVALLMSTVAFFLSLVFMLSLHSDVQSLEIGYWLWVSGILIFLLGTIVLYFFSTDNKRKIAE